MKRSMMQAYVKDAIGAMEFYKKAFGAELAARYVDQTGKILQHGELNVYGQILALAELPEDKPETGNTMQFCLHLGDGQEGKVREIYEMLRDEAKITFPLGSCDWSTLMVGLIDKYGVSWCIFA